MGNASWNTIDAIGLCISRDLIFRATSTEHDIYARGFFARQVLVVADTYHLVADLGGTNVRFALVQEGKAVPEHVEKFANNNYDSFEEAAQDYLAKVDALQPDKACIAVAAPIHGEPINLTNYGWQLSAPALCRQLGLREVVFVNDYQALALALPDLKSSDRVQIGNHGCGVKHGTRLVIGPGTGLGVCGLVRAGEHNLPVSGEGGHISFAARTVQEVELMQAVAGESSVVSAEWLLNGKGLERLYNGLAAISGRQAVSISAREISQQALAGNLACVEALNLYCGFLGRVAGDYALIFGATGGVYLGGGILRRFPEFLAASPFRSEFDDKGVMGDYARAIPTFLITARHKTLWGACAWLRQGA